MYYTIPRNTTAVQGIPIGRLNDIDSRLAALESGSTPSDTTESVFVITVSTGANMMFKIPTGLVNSSNTSYTVASEPLYVVADGVTYYDGAGYTYSPLTVTMTNPPTQYIRYVIVDTPDVITEIPSGSVNSSNVTFTVTDFPTMIVADGTTYFENDGYTIDGFTVTMDNPPTQYIRSVYRESSFMSRSAPVGTIDGSNTTFTVFIKPACVVSDGTTYFNGDGYTYTGSSVVMDDPPTQYVWYFY